MMRPLMRVLFSQYAFGLISLLICIPMVITLT